MVIIIEEPTISADIIKLCGTVAAYRIDAAVFNFHRITVRKVVFMDEFMASVDPVNPVQPGYSFSAAPDFNITQIIKYVDPSLCPLNSLRWCSC